jgi:hypothetical protein
MIAEKWEPVFGNEHAKIKKGATMIHINQSDR